MVVGFEAAERPRSRGRHLALVGAAILALVLGTMLVRGVPEKPETPVNA